AVFARAAGAGLHRRAEHCLRAALRGGAHRGPPEPRRGAGPSSTGCHIHRRHTGGASRQGSDRDDPDRLCPERRPDWLRAGLSSRAARGQPDGTERSNGETGAKRLELLVTAVPDAKRVAVLWNPDIPPSDPELREIEEAAHSLGREVIPAEVRGPEGLEPAFRKIAKQGAEALIVVAAPTF